MTMMHERMTTVELPQMLEDRVVPAELAVLAIAQPTTEESVVATAASDLEAPTSELVALQEVQVEEPPVEPQTARAAGFVSLYPGERSASLVNYQEQAAAKEPQTPQERLDAAVARWGGTSADSILAMQQRNTRRLNNGFEPYSVVTALLGGYLPGTRRY